MSSRKIMSSLLIGVVIGILIAPDKGSRTRKKLSNKATSFTEGVQEIIDTTKEKLEMAKEKILQLADKGKNKIEDVEEKSKTILS